MEELNFFVLNIRFDARVIHQVRQIIQWVHVAILDAIMDSSLRVLTLEIARPKVVGMGRNQVAFENTLHWIVPSTQVHN